MQYVWRFRLAPIGAVKTVDGQRIDVIDPGILNTDAGPDFFNAKIRINGEVWAGNVEIHVRASDWYRHGHSKDPAYDSVSLHVVAVDDARIQRRDGSVIPQIVMPCSPDFSARYSALVDNPLSDLPCAAEIASIPSVFISDWVTALAFERVYEKSEIVAQYAAMADDDWASAAYSTLARALGFSVNAEPFEQLSRRVPLKAMLKHSDNRLSVEALLFGQAGLLESPEKADSETEVYLSDLKNEFSFLCSKFRLSPPTPLAWKRGRMRPQNFPHRRVALLAAFIADGFPMAHKLIAIRNIDQARALFDVKVPDYWAWRYSFGPKSSVCTPLLSSASRDVLVINVVVPFLMAFGIANGREDLQSIAMEILEHVKGEKNKITELFSTAGIDSRNAFTSQALIQLNRRYCRERKCLYCRIGHRLLAARVAP